MRSEMGLARADSARERASYPVQTGKPSIRVTHVAALGYHPSH